MIGGENAIAPNGVVHRLNLSGLGGVICGAFILSSDESTEYWLFWVRKPVTCMTCLARLEVS